VDVPLEPHPSSGVASDRRPQLSTTVTSPLRRGGALDRAAVARLLLQRAAASIDELNVLAGGGGVLDKVELRRKLDEPTWLVAIALDELEGVGETAP
jgi:hypothetical protein